MKTREVNFIPKQVKLIKETDDEIILKYASSTPFKLWSLAISGLLGFFALIIVLLYVIDGGIDNIPFIPATLVAICIWRFIAYYSYWTKLIITKDYLIVSKQKYKLDYCDVRGRKKPYGYYIYLSYGSEKINLPHIRDNGTNVIIYIQEKINQFTKASRDSHFIVTDAWLKF